MELHKPTQEEEKKDIFSNGKIISEKIGKLLGDVRFLNKEKIPSNDRLKTLLKTKEELITEIQKTGSNNLLEVRKNGPEKEIAYRLEDILTAKNQEEREKLTTITYSRNTFTKEEKELAQDFIKSILDNLHLFSKHIKNENISEKITTIINNYLFSIKNTFNEIIIIDEKFLKNKEENIEKRIQLIENFKSSILLLYPMIPKEEQIKIEETLKTYEKRLTIFKKD